MESRCSLLLSNGHQAGDSRRLPQPALHELEIFDHLVHAVPGTLDARTGTMLRLIEQIPQHVAELAGYPVGVIKRAHDGWPSAGSGLRMRSPSKSPAISIRVEVTSS